MVDQIIETTVVGCGYDLVDIERASGGILRIYIDIPIEETKVTNRLITLDDCETVSHQLSRVLMVENVEYDRLEVSSPGLDRPLKKVTDFERFAGSVAKIKLKKPLDGVSKRKTYQGILLKPDGDELMLEFETDDANNNSVLHFQMADIEKANLVPQVNFRSKKR